MTDNFIQLEKNDILRIGIKDENGKILDGVFEFDFEDSSVLLKYQEMIEKNERNKKWLKNQYLIISKRQDVKGKKLLSKNEEDKLEADKTFFKRTEEIYNMFLGENGVQKLLNGRKLSWATLIKIDEIIEKQFEPFLIQYKDRLEQKYKDKYINATKKAEEIEVLK